MTTISTCLRSKQASGRADSGSLNPRKYVGVADSNASSASGSSRISSSFQERIRVEVSGGWSVDAPVEHKSRLVAEFNAHGSGKHELGSPSQHDIGNSREIAGSECTAREGDFNVWIRWSDCDLEYGSDFIENECVVFCLLVYLWYNSVAESRDD